MDESKKKKIYPYVGKIPKSSAKKPIVLSYDNCAPWQNADVSFYWVNFEFPSLHGHTDWELFIVLNDQIMHEVNGEEKLLTAGEACLLGPKHVHSLYYPNKEKNMYQSVCFPIRDRFMQRFLGVFSPTLYEEIATTKEPLYFTLAKNSLEQYTNSLLEIQTYTNQNTPHTEQRCILILTDIMLKFLTQRQAKSNLPEVLSPFIQKLNNPLITSEQIKEAQAELPYSYPQLTRIFKKYLHCTITQYVNRTKLEYAKELLINTDMTLVEITSELNFESTSHFHSLFKKYFGVTPAEYRKQNRIS